MPKFSRLVTKKPGSGLNALGAALTNKIGSIGDALTGTVRVDNSKNPNSAYSQIQKSVGKGPSPYAPKPAPKKPFKSTLPPNQKVFGVGVGP